MPCHDDRCNTDEDQRRLDSAEAAHRKTRERLTEVTQAACEMAALIRSYDGAFEKLSENTRTWITDHEMFDRYVKPALERAKQEANRLDAEMARYMNQPRPAEKQ